MELIIRRAEERDLEAIADMETVCFPQDPWSYDAFYNEIVENDKTIYLIAEAGGEPAGYMGVWEILDEGHITNVAVHPDRRGEGIAKVLMKLLIDYCDNIFVRDITLEVRPDNEAAIGLYKAFGFVEEGRRKQNGFEVCFHESAVFRI